MAIQLTIKNTFLDIVNPTEFQSKRSSSLPRSWKPVSTSTCGISENPNFPSDISTADSNECSTVADLEVSSGVISSGSSDCDNTPMQHSDEQQVKTILDLSPAIMMNNTKLSSKARLFEPVPSLQGDMRVGPLTARRYALLEPVYHCLKTFCASFCGHPNIISVRMCDSNILSGTISISASYRLPHRFRKVCQLVDILSVIKMALLEAASKSTGAYILGYMNQPFIDGPTGFSVKLGAVLAEDDTACWDTIQKGYCPRPRRCCWSHPHESDFAKVVVDLSEEQ